ncbi:MAG: sigma-54-dependent Fis family transcriptional regulator [Deferribacteres bacterium]|nr:sigma-54-dependent Fis family transcriptional regulator [candidate division KSB1 bacterium]MCB9503118.1 sigma-54-dependent Fis family transcriptional regulator [Deferribacteres bacterium]
MLKEKFKVEILGGDVIPGREIITRNFDLIVTLWSSRQNTSDKPSPNMIDAMFLSGEQTRKQVVQVYRNGFYKRQIDDKDLKDFVNTVKHLLPYREKQKHKEKLLYEMFIGKSQHAEDVREKIRRYSQLPQINMLVTGETGTGKEVVVDLLHKLSPRSDKPLVKVNCPAIPEHLFESQMFGHKKGAFTGALTDMVGFVKQANGGTLFLDEISSINVNLQAKMLRFIETMYYQPIGATKEMKADVRIIAASNHDINELIKDGQFREDLYYRINMGFIELQPLRSRERDILPLCYHFMKYSQKISEKKLPKFDSKVITLLKNYHWPGNVRELKNIIANLSIIQNNLNITLEKLLQPICNDENVRNGSNLTLAENEKKHILNIFLENDKIIYKTATTLGIDRKTLRRKLHSFGLSAS